MQSMSGGRQPANDDGGDPAESPSRVEEVCKQIANDPQIRTKAHAWLDLFVFRDVATLDPDGALSRDQY